MNSENPAGILFNTSKQELLSPEALVTPFGDLRVASAFTQADLVHKYQIDPLEFGTSLTGAGTVSHNPNNSAADISVTGANGDVARMSTHTYFRYQAGKSTRWRTTLWFETAPVPSQVARWGYFDANDGLLFERDENGLYVTRRSSTSGSMVPDRVGQASWNHDPMDGSGPSGIIVDSTKGNIYECVFQWLGVGDAWFFINGNLVHRMEHANQLAGPYMRTAVLPMRWEVENQAATSAQTLHQVCTSVYSEGGTNNPSVSFSAFNGANVPVTTTERPVLSIRPALLYKGIENRTLVLPKRVSVSTEGQRIGFRLVLNTALTGASWGAVDTDSAMEFDTSATAFAGGTPIYRDFLPNSTDGKDVDISDLFDVLARKLRRKAFGTDVDVLSLLAVNEAAGTTQVRSSFVWGEVR